MKDLRIILVFILIATHSWAEERSDVPTSLFGITLGGTYDIGDPDANNLGNLPVKKFAGVQRFLGSGIHYYFQPIQEYKFFNYVEERKNPDDRYFETSFRLYLLPAIPPNVTTLDQLRRQRTDWEVCVISWSTDPKNKDDAYYWAMDLCKTFETEISVKPEITKDLQSKFYQCTFSRGDREFKITGLGLKTVELSFRGDVFEAKDESIDEKLRKMQAKEIRPW